MRRRVAIRVAGILFGIALWAVPAVAVCNDGVLDAGETCDGGPPLDLAGETCNSLGFPGGTLQCAPDCLSFDTGDCLPVPTCGNMTLEPGEACDGPLLNGQNCATQGFQPGGALSCLPDCSGFHTDGCTPAAVPPDPCVFHNVTAPDKQSFGWGTPADIDVVRGPLRKVRAYKVDQLRRDYGVAAVDTSADNPASGAGFWYLFKHVTTCPPPAVGPAGIPTWHAQGAVFDRDELLPDGGCNRRVPDVWTVNGNSQTFTAINGCTDQVRFGGNLSAAGDGRPPRSIAFSTVPGAQGSFAFVSQGDFIQVIDAFNGTLIDQINVAALIGRPGICSISGMTCTADPQCLGGGDVCQPAVDLRGIGTSIPQLFLTPAPTEAAFLYIAANVRVTPNDQRPWFIVLDQGPALDGAGGLGSLVQDAELQIPGPAGNAEAVDVTVISTPNQNDTSEHQRAWFSARDGANSQLFARLVATPAAIVPPNWTVRRTVVTTGQTGVPPQFSQIGAGDRGELALQGEGDQGGLLDLENAVPATACNFGGTQVAVEVEGPASGGYTVYAIDRQADVARIVRETDIDGLSCPAAQNVPLGVSPTAVDVMGQSFQVKAFVANGGDDTVTSFDKHGQQVETIALPAADMTPVDIAVQATPARSCNVAGVDVSGPSVTFDPVGCDPGQIFMVWCRCTDATGLTCPPECPYDPLLENCPQCEEIGDNPWDELGSVEPGGQAQVPPPQGSVEIEVTAEEREPLP